MKSVSRVGLARSRQLVAEATRCRMRRLSDEAPLVVRAADRGARGLGRCGFGPAGSGPRPGTRAGGWPRRWWRARSRRSTRPRSRSRWKTARPSPFPPGSGPVDEHQARLDGDGVLRRGRSDEERARSSRSSPRPQGQSRSPGGGRCRARGAPTDGSGHSAAPPGPVAAGATEVRAMKRPLVFLVDLAQLSVLLVGAWSPRMRSRQGLPAPGPRRPPVPRRTGAA